MTLEKVELEFGNSATSCSHVVESRDQSVAEGLAFFLNFSSSALSRRLLRVPDPRLAASRLERDERLLKERLIVKKLAFLCSIIYASDGVGDP
jgi:hypothetical protein